MKQNEVILTVKITFVCASQLRYNSAALEKFNLVFQRVNLVQRNIQAHTYYFRGNSLHLAQQAFCWSFLEGVCEERNLWEVLFRLFVELNQM